MIGTLFIRFVASVDKSYAVLVEGDELVDRVIGVLFRAAIREEGGS